jgi:hypothetical protein
VVETALRESKAFESGKSKGVRMWTLLAAEERNCTVALLYIIGILILTLKGQHWGEIEMFLLGGLHVKHAVQRRNSVPPQHLL